MRNLTRRDFLEDAAIAGVALAIPSALAAWARRDGNDLTLANDAIAAAWTVDGGALRAVRVTDLAGSRTLSLPPDVFTLTLQDGSVLGAAAMRVTAAPRIELIAGDPGAARLAERLGGRQLAVDLEDVGHRLRVTWRAVLRDGSRYLRQEITLYSSGGDVPVREIRLLDLELPGAEVMGTVRGSPVVADPWFLGFEHPLSESVVQDGRARCFLIRELPLRAGAAVTVSSVIGATAAGQRRRGFLEYLERERAHPSRPFLHYNSWYDIGYFSKYDEVAALGVIDAFGSELHERRGVTLDSFLFDDGWDDPRTLWRFHAGFPRGFTQLRQAAARYGAGIGVWMSPWGGYGLPRQERVAAGSAAGFETVDNGFALSGPTYYRRFQETCLDMIRTYGVNQFKFDGTGNAARVVPGSAFDSDFDAMLALIGDLRDQRADLYVNLTTGTYPSPFFLRACDSIWRGGEDHEFAGVGSLRQQWITYRDADTFAGIVQKGPLFPLNALMLHGLVFARSAHCLDSDPQNDFPAEIRAYFGSGTQLQEMYVTPALLSPAHWDVLAESARWARARAPTLVDTHWIGGDPAKLEVYGHAAWGGDGKGILVLRNPKDAPQTMAVDVAAAFELPERSPRRLRLASPWRADRGRPTVELTAGEPRPISLAPLEVLTLETA